MQAVRVQADILVRDSEGKELALVEVKNRQELSPDIAATLRRNLLTHGLSDRNSRYFLLLSQDRGYLWEQQSSRGHEESLPAVEFSMVPVVDHYLPSLKDTVRLSESQLELAMTQWLWDLANGVENLPDEPEAALSRTDFPRLVRGGRIDSESGS